MNLASLDWLNAGHSLDTWTPPHLRELGSLHNKAQALGLGAPDLALTALLGLPSAARAPRAFATSVELVHGNTLAYATTLDTHNLAKASAMLGLQATVCFSLLGQGGRSVDL